ncbi:NAD(P)-binding protein [Xylariomycetidae sp. FL0641]|nr:NAD(P)-binding protein [Xylariomycetidae sp. FL0641]
MAKMSESVMMRIAIAGAGGFAALLARELSQSANAVLVLSTRAHPEFEDNYECQVTVVDYANLDALKYALMGVDLVISTITGPEQLNLIDAARRSRVRCFVPSGFEGSLSHRPANDPFDNGTSAALDQLRHWSTSRHYPMKYTVFSCGIFYERFAPGGLSTFNMGVACRLLYQGDYMINVGTGTAELPETNAQGRPVQITMTSAEDVARFVAAAVDLGIDHWPREFKMRGERLTPHRIQQQCSQVRQIAFDVTTRPYSQLLDWLRFYEQNHDETHWFQMQHLLQTANGRYNFGEANLNDLVNFEPMKFRDWLANNWGPAQ